MRICMVTSSVLPPEEGLGHHVWNLARFLVSQNHIVQIVTRGQRGCPSFEEIQGIPVWRPFFLPVYPLHVEAHGIFVNRLIARLEREVDVFHSHSPLTPVLRTRRPLLLTVHSSRRRPAPPGSALNFRAWLVRLQTPFSIALEQRQLARANQVAVVAAHVAQELTRHSVNAERISVVGNGVYTTFFTPAASDSATLPFILTVGRLEMGKGLEDLIACASAVVAQFPQARFAVAGHGPLEAKLRRMIEAAHLTQHISLIGQISDRLELVNLYRQAAVIVHPSHYEGLPTVLLEAMACARPIVATDIAGAREVIEPEINGLLVPPRDSQNLAHAILRLLSDPPLSKRLGHMARHTVETRYSWEAVGARYIQLYRQLSSENVPDSI